MQRRSRIRVIGFIVLALALMFSATMAFAETVSIGTPEQLAAFRDRVNAGEPELNATLTANIPLSGNWEPIGYYKDSTEDYSYVGTFDGGGFTITGLNVPVASAVTSKYNEVAGLFGVVGADGVVKNVTIQGANVDVGDAPMTAAGAAVGFNEGTVQSVTVTGGTMKGTNAGGVAGYNEGGGVDGCVVSGVASITGGNVGSVAGYNEEGEVTNCVVSGIGTIMARYSAGGVAGSSEKGEVTNCTASGIETIKSGADTGGVVGYNGAGTITYCAASDIGTIEGTESAGGVVGYNEWYDESGASGTVANCTASDIGTIEGTGRVGGIAGYNDDGTITNCVLLPRADGDTKISGKVDQTGGVLGVLDGGKANIDDVKNCLFPDTGIVFTNNDEKRPIGNIPLDDMVPANNVTSYDPEDPENTLAILATFLQGVTLEIELGKSYPFDVTGIPGTKGLADATFTWGVADDTIVGLTGTGPQVTLKGVALGKTDVTCAVNSDVLSGDLTCAVTVVEAKPEPVDPTHKSSSNCGTLPGVFALFALAALPFIRKQK